MLDMKDVNTKLTLPSECRLGPLPRLGNTAETSRRKLLSKLRKTTKYTEQVDLYREKPQSVQITRRFSS